MTIQIAAAPDEEGSPAPERAAPPVHPNRGAGHFDRNRSRFAQEEHERNQVPRAQWSARSRFLVRALGSADSSTRYPLVTLSHHRTTRVLKRNHS